MIVLTENINNTGVAIVKIKEVSNNYIPNSQVGELEANLIWNASRTEAALVLPENITHIGDFNESSAAEIEFTEHVDKTSSEMEKVTIVVLPESLEVIKAGFFNRFSNLRSIEFPPRSRIEKIYPRAFADCANLEELVIPQNAKGFEVEIKADAFVGCENLYKLEIPVNSAIVLYCNQPLKGCDNLVELHLRGNAKVLTPNDEDDRILTENERHKFVMLLEFQNDDSAYISPLYSIKQGNSIFNSNLRNITLPRNTKTIGYKAFMSYTNLENINMPERATSIGEKAFARCCALKAVKIPYGVTEIGECAFSACDLLKEIVIPEGVSEIKFFTFGGCTSLKDVKLPTSIVHIGRAAFAECSSLEKIEIPETVEKIRSDAFVFCQQLKDVYISNKTAVSQKDVFLDCHPSIKMHKIHSRKNLISKIRKWIIKCIRSI